MLRQVLRAERTALLGWGLGLFVFMVVIGASYKSFAESDAFADFGEEFEDFGQAFNADSFTTVDGYLMSQAVALFPLLFGIYTVIAAAKHLAGSVESGRIDHVLSRPLTRGQHLRSSLGGVLLTTTFIGVATAAGTVLGLMASEVEGKALLSACGMLLDTAPIILFHFGIGAWIASAVGRRGLAVGAGMALVVGGFAVSIFGRVVSDLEWLQYVTIYGLWDRSDLFHGDPDWIYWLVGVAVGLGTSALALRTWDRRDL